ncbi:DUF4376 domain-containing protein [Bosea sp. TND4EK4]|uniref:DUF4376 domain-containing protein n=1 Tax=Bosea sp. TND4EK4 TaxID=1907408 RepID=UPI000955F9FB|nr:DUF4376 domain-containing protein [Bosea sp. TND4EK4]SIP96475.1 protein of unknown function [Bosea sp. TND4EK4]
MKLARTVADTIVEFIKLPEGVPETVTEENQDGELISRPTTLADCFHPDFLAGLVEVADNAEIGWVDIAGEFVRPRAPSLDLIAYAAERRWQLEIGGITAAGQTIDTSRASQAMIAGADALAQVDPEEPVDFKAASGWVTLDAATLHAIALAVGRHVRGLFRREREIAEAIAAGTITSTAEIDAAFTA